MRIYTKHTDSQGIEDLGPAIVLQAVKDLQFLKEHGLHEMKFWSSGIKFNVEELWQFFNSDECNFYCKNIGISGREIFKEIWGGYLDDNSGTNGKGKE